ncbi:MAG: alanine--glyoxylate aminotransferase family protein [Clostridiaceae bacterium]|nr:alanine--glyoxylate aminotransferase family protein [Clostridiaceae bacterium]
MKREDDSPRLKGVRLFIPGPVEVDNDVLELMSQPVQPHYGRDWTSFYNQTIHFLKRIFITNGNVYIMVGSGSAGIDACLGSAFSKGEKIIVGVNGFFGNRLVEIAESHEINVVQIDFAWDKPICPVVIEEIIEKNPDTKGIAVVHLETSTGVVNPVEQIGRVCKEHNIIFFVDAVSSLGGVPFSMDDFHIDLCASASQKCLGAPPGLSLVAVGKNGWNKINSIKGHSNGWYLNLRNWQKYSDEWADWHPYPITMATSNVVALNASLNQLLDEGLEKRIAHYKDLAVRLRKGLALLGYKPFTPNESMAPIMTVAYGPKDVHTSKIVDYLLDVHNLKIAGGLGQLHDKIIRIGHMSPRINQDDIDLLLNALREFAKLS